VKYIVDENGLLDDDSRGAYMYTVAEFGSIFGYLGLYVGQVLFRYRGWGRLGIEAFTSKPGLLHQVIYALLIYCIFQTPVWLCERYKKGMSLLVEAIFARAIFTFITGFLISYSLPRLTTSIASYPVTTAEALATD